MSVIEEIEIVLGYFKIFTQNGYWNVTQIVADYLCQLAKIRKRIKADQYTRHFPRYHFSSKDTTFV
jgi:hypothetical protein